MRVIDLVIEASQAVFGWSARHESCLMLEVHPVQPNCEATVKARERDVLRTVVVGLADLVFIPSAVTLGIRLRRFEKKKSKNISASHNVLCGSKTLLSEGDGRGTSSDAGQISQSAKSLRHQVRVGTSSA